MCEICWGNLLDGEIMWIIPEKNYQYQHTQQPFWMYDKNGIWDYFSLKKNHMNMIVHKPSSYWGTPIYGNPQIYGLGRRYIGETIMGTVIWKGKNGTMRWYQEALLQQGVTFWDFDKISLFIWQSSIPSCHRKQRNMWTNYVKKFTNHALIWPSYILGNIIYEFKSTKKPWWMFTNSGEFTLTIIPVITWNHVALDAWTIKNLAK